MLSFFSSEEEDIEKEVEIELIKLRERLRMLDTTNTKETTESKWETYKRNLRNLIPDIEIPEMPSAIIEGIDIAKNTLGAISSNSKFFNEIGQVAKVTTKISSAIAYLDVFNSVLTATNSQLVSRKEKKIISNIEIAKTEVQAIKRFTRIAESLKFKPEINTVEPFAQYSSTEFYVPDYNFYKFIKGSKVNITFKENTKENKATVLESKDIVTKEFLQKFRTELLYYNSEKKINLSKVGNIDELKRIFIINKDNTMFCITPIECISLSLLEGELLELLILFDEYFIYYLITFEREWYIEEILKFLVSHKDFEANNKKKFYERIGAIIKTISSVLGDNMEEGQKKIWETLLSKYVENSIVT